MDEEISEQTGTKPFVGSISEPVDLYSGHKITFDLLHKNGPI